MKVDYFTDKGVGLMNEDDFLIKDNLFCVFDGATSLVKYIDLNGETGGKLGSHYVKEVFAANSNKPLLEIAKLANERLQQEMEKRKIDTSDKVNRWGTTLAVVRITPEVIEYAQVGDTPILFFKKDGSVQMVQTSNIPDKPILVLFKKLIQQGVNDVRSNKEFIDLVQSVRRTVNITYGTINGEKEVFQFLQHGTLLKKDIAHILLMTDGIKVLYEDPEQEEDFTFLQKLFLKGGLQALKKYVRDTENSDPESRKYPRFKTHDDATAIAITL